MKVAFLTWLNISLAKAPAVCAERWCFMHREKLIQAFVISTEVLCTTWVSMFILHYWCSLFSRDMGRAEKLGGSVEGVGLLLHMDEFRFTLKTISCYLNHIGSFRLRRPAISIKEPQLSWCLLMSHHWPQRIMLIYTAGISRPRLLTLPVL